MKRYQNNNSLFVGMVTYFAVFCIMIGFMIYQDTQGNKPNLSMLLLTFGVPLGAGCTGYWLSGRSTSDNSRGGGGDIGD